MRVIKQSLVLVVCMAAVVATATASAADTPFVVTNGGDEPHVVVDSNGTGHFVWSEGARPSVLHYCKIAQGQRACTGAQSFVPPAGSDSSNRDYQGPNIVVPSPSRVLLLTKRCCSSDADGLYVYESNDGGQSFAAPRRIGKTSPDGAVLTASGSLGVLDGESSDGLFQALDPAGAYSTNGADLFSSIGRRQGSLAPVGGGMLAAVSTSNSEFTDGKILYRRISGGDPNNVANWSPTAEAAKGADGTLAYGPAGISLFNRQGQAGKEAYYLRGYDPASNAFARSLIQFSSLGSPTGGTAFQDGSGTTHGVWTESDANGTQKLVYKYYATRPVPALATTTLLNFSSKSTRAYSDIQLSASSAGKGFVVWNADFGGTNQLLAMPIYPGAGGVVEVDPTNQNEKKSGDFTLITPTKGCVVPGQIRTELKVKKKRRQSRTGKRLKVTKVEFYLDKKKVKTTKRSPYKTVLDLRNLKPGTTHTIRARIIYRLQGKKKPGSKNIKQTIKIC